MRNTKTTMFTLLLMISPADAPEALELSGQPRDIRGMDENIIFSILDTRCQISGLSEIISANNINESDLNLSDSNASTSSSSPSI